MATRKKSPSRKKAPAKKAAPATPRVARKIYAQASPKSLGGVSMFDVDDLIQEDTVANFASEPSLMERSVYRLQDAGFDVLQVSETAINICGTPRTFKDAFGAEIVAEDRPVIKGGAMDDVATFMECHNAERPGLISCRQSSFDDILEGVALEEPRYFMAGEDAFPPSARYWHLDVPGDVSLACNADRAHRGGVTGKGVTVAMCDSGWYRHSFFTDRGYRSTQASLGPGASNPDRDESGHGTGESANIFANAPDVNLRPVKMSFVNTIAAFNLAVGLNPDIITNSWGSSKRFGPLSAADQAMAAAIAAAVNSGICVVFSAGNGHWGFPGQHPDVISAGGVFMHRDGSMRASNYSSGFDSNIYPNRRVPDLSGLVGMSPKAMYIMLPLEARDDIDQGNAGGTHPEFGGSGANAGDETANNDGWAAFSGTSAAAPQLAGVAALIKQACPRLGPKEVRSIMMSTARDVTQGNCSPGTGSNPATVGPDNATGHGLVDAHKAVLRAKLRCLIRPIQPPIQPIQPVQPIQPIQPIAPIRPPIMPVQPIQPIRPIRPIQPVGPVAPLEQQTGLAAQYAAAEAAAGGTAINEDDLRAMEEMADRGELDLDDLG